MVFEIKTLLGPVIWRFAEDWADFNKHKRKYHGLVRCDGIESLGVYSRVVSYRVVKRSSAAFILMQRCESW